MHKSFPDIVYYKPLPFTKEFTSISLLAMDTDLRLILFRKRKINKEKN